MTDYEKIETVKRIIIEVLNAMGFSATVEFEDSITKGLIFNINTSNSFLIIGRQGVALHALQSVIQSLTAKIFKNQTPFIFSLDVDDYKRKREWFLKEIAKGAVEQVKRTGRPVALEPMPNFERKFIHSFLQENHPDISSESSGFDPHRKIIVRRIS